MVTDGAKFDSTVHNDMFISVKFFHYVLIPKWSTFIS